MSTAAALSRQTRAVESVTPQQRSRAQSQAKSSIESNPFYAIMFSESAPEAKRTEAAKALTFTGTKEEMRQRVQAFAAFMEYMQTVREEMAQEIIKLTDTEAFAQLKTVYDELNTALVDFDDRMQPLVEIIDAVSKLNQEGLALDAFREIKDDRIREEEFEKKRKAKNEEIASTGLALENLRNTNARLSEKKGFFGLGGIKEDARVEMATNQQSIQRLEAELEEKRRQLDDDAKLLQESTSKLGAFQAEKDKIRAMLDITSDGHKKNQEALVQAALHFVQTSKQKLGEVRNHQGKMDDQIEGLLDANTNMTSVYAILNDSIKEAEKENQAVRSAFLAPESGEDMITKTVREEKKRDIENHIKNLDAAAVDTMSTYADLTSQAIRVGDMKAANEAQKNKATALATRGVAGVADRLSTVLQAVSAAAISESASLAQQTLERMAQSTNTVAQKESIRIAMGAQSVNDDLQKALADLSAYGETKRQTTEITREAVSDMRSNLEALQEMARGVQDDISEGSAVNAEVGGGTVSSKGPAKPTTKSPFARVGK